MALEAIRAKHPVDWPPPATSYEAPGIFGLLWAIPDFVALSDCNVFAAHFTRVAGGMYDIDGFSGNGFKHCLGSCCLAARLGPEDALFYLDIHEINNMNDTLAQHANNPEALATGRLMTDIDNVNNRLGVSFGAYASAHASKCHDVPNFCCFRMCLCAFHNDQIAAV